MRNIDPRMLLVLSITGVLGGVAGATLLTRSYTPAERFRAQGANDLAIFGTQAVASLLAGTALEQLGWGTLNMAVLPLLALVAWTAWRLPLTTRESRHA